MTNALMCPFFFILHSKLAAGKSMCRADYISMHLQDVAVMEEK